MLLDWFGHLQRDKIRRESQKRGVGPATRELARVAVASIETRALGHYRDLDGRIGAVQVVVIPKARAFVGLVNTAISEAILREVEGGWDLQRKMPRTAAGIAEAAREGRKWVSLHGDSVFSFPVHPLEWAQARAAGIRGFLDDFVQALAKRRQDKRKPKPEWMVQALAPFSITEEGNEVAFGFGDPKTPRTFRVQLRDRYEPSLEKVVIENVPRELDAVSAEILLEKDRAAPAGVGDFLRWGPPEDRVRAVLGAARSEDPKVQLDATSWLASFAAEWNRDAGVPEAPARMADRSAWLTRWEHWYREVLAFPLVAREKKQ